MTLKNKISSLKGFEFKTNCVFIACSVEFYGLIIIQNKLSHSRLSPLIFFLKRCCFNFRMKNDGVHFIKSKVNLNIGVSNIKIMTVINSPS